MMWSEICATFVQNDCYEFLGEAPQENILQKSILNEAAFWR